MSILIPIGALETALSFHCPCCSILFSSNLLIPEVLKKSRIKKNGDKVHLNKIKCTNSDCKENIKLTVTITESQILIDINNVVDEEIEQKITYDPFHDYYNEQIESIVASDDFFEIFETEIKNLRLLNNVDTGNYNLDNILKKQIYIATIINLEIFLSDTFINLTLRDDEKIKKFVKYSPEFKNLQFNLRDVFEQYEMIKETSKKVMMDTLYHNLFKVEKMYLEVLNIQLPILEQPLRCVKTRHDLVHRNGKNKDGIDVRLNKSEIDKVITIIENFVSNIQLLLDDKYKPQPVSMKKFTVPILNDDDMPF